MCVCVCVCVCVYVCACVCVREREREREKFFPVCVSERSQAPGAQPEAENCMFLLKKSQK